MSGYSKFGYNKFLIDIYWFNQDKETFGTDYVEDTHEKKNFLSWWTGPQHQSLSRPKSSL